MASRIHVEFGPERCVDLSLGELELLRLIPYQAQIVCGCGRGHIKCLEMWPLSQSAVAAMLPEVCSKCGSWLDKTLLGGRFAFGLDFDHQQVRYDMVHDGK